MCRVRVRAAGCCLLPKGVTPSWLHKPTTVSEEVLHSEHQWSIAAFFVLSHACTQGAGTFSPRPPANPQTNPSENDHLQWVYVLHCSWGPLAGFIGASIQNAWSLIEIHKCRTPQFFLPPPPSLSPCEPPPRFIFIMVHPHSIFFAIWPHKFLNLPTAPPNVCTVCGPAALQSLVSRHFRMP